MEKQELLNEIKNLKDDFLNKRMSLTEIKNSFELLESATNVPLNTLYNAFMSSKPELYINQYF